MEKGLCVHSKIMTSYKLNILRSEANPNNLYVLEAKFYNGIEIRISAHSKKELTMNLADALQEFTEALNSMNVLYFGNEDMIFIYDHKEFKPKYK